MQPTTLCAAILALLLSAPSVPAVADQVSTSFLWSAGGDLDVDLGVATAVGRGQGFRPEIEGRLRSVAFLLSRTGGDGSTLRIGIHRVDNLGGPVMPALATRDFPATLVPAGGTFAPVTFDMAGTGLLLDTETKYAITIVVDPPTSDVAPLRMNGSASGPSYQWGLGLGSPDGTLWLPAPNLDYAFEVWVGDAVAGEALSAGSLKSRFR